MSWINRESQFPDDDKILCYGKNEIYIARQIEIKGEVYYLSTDWGHGEYQNEPEWTHWMPLPEGPNETTKQV